MKKILRQLFSPLLNVFEQGNEPYEYKPMSRRILLVISVLFSILTAVTFFLSPADAGLGIAFPMIIFGGASFVCLVVGALGNERAVAKIWGSR